MDQAPTAKLVAPMFLVLVPVDGNGKLATTRVFRAPQTQPQIHTLFLTVLGSSSLLAAEKKVLLFATLLHVFNQSVFHLPRESWISFLVKDIQGSGRRGGVKQIDACRVVALVPY